MMRRGLAAALAMLAALACAAAGPALQSRVTPIAEPSKTAIATFSAV